MTEQKPTTEEVFRGALEEVVDCAAKLAPYCASVEEMISVCKLALENDGQLRLLLAMMSLDPKKR